jgi:pimeloyl-ACP methyl ester carboxylesterase
VSNALPPERYEVESKDGTRIPVWRSGSGRPLVLVHGGAGGGGSHASWEGARPYLEAQATVITLDRRCTFGDTTAPYELEREFEDVAAVVRSVTSEVDLLGTSSGAICALGASVLAPNLRRLVLYEPPLFDAAMRSSALKLGELYADGDLLGVHQTFVRDLLRNPTMAAAPPREGWEKTAKLYPREMVALAGWSFEPERFRQMKAPTLLLVGENTPATHHHRGFIDLLRGVLPDLTLGELPGQEHSGPRLAPRLFAEIVLDFLGAEAVV